MATGQATGYYELYRGTSIGMALADTLDDLISNRRIEPQLAMRVLANFDEAVAKVLADRVKARMTFKVSARRGEARRCWNTAEATLAKDVY